MILRKLFEKRLSPNRGTLHLLSGMSNYTASGVAVTHERALTVSAVFACIRVIAESVASLPLITYQRRRDGGKDRATNHHLYELLKEQPNREMTSFEFREMTIAHVAARGNAYAEIEYDRAGRAVGLWPLNPAKMRVERIDGELAYQYTLPNGQTRNLPWWRVHHIRNWGDGVTGYSVIKLASQGIGYTLAMEEQDARFYGNGARPGMVLKHPGKLSDQAYSRLQTSWEARHQGIENAHRMAILEEGMGVETIGLSKEDSQFIESRKFQVNEVCRWFRVPPHMVADLDRATFSNVEQQSLDFVIHTLRPWLVRSEQAMRRDLIAPEERRNILVEYLVDGLLRGDSAARQLYYQSGRQNGWLSANDIRRMENLNPIDGGDEYLVPLNMVPAGQAGDSPAGMDENDDDGQRDHDPACDCDTHSRRIESLSETRADEDDEPEDVRKVRTQRQRLARSYVGLYEEVAARVIRREANDVRRAVNKHLRKRSLSDFLEWVTTFYREWDEVIIEAFRALMLTYGDQVLGSVADELDEDEDGLTDELRTFIEEYLAAFGDSWAAFSRRQIEELAEATTAGDEETAELIEERLDGWLETQAKKVALAQAFEGLNALVVATYGVYQVVSLRWAASGDSCPFCQQLNGKIVGRGDYFIEGGSSIDAGDGSTPMLVRRNKKYGPLHGGCDCVVVAVR
ncbi:MAG: phage portal protein [Chloroflexota bacterium]